MKFSSAVPLLALALGVVAEPTRTLNGKASLVERDLAAVTQVIAKINQGVADLDTAIKGFSGDASDMLAKSQALTSSVKSGTTSIEALPELTLTDAASVAGTVQSLQTAIDGVVTDLIGKKEAIVAAGAASDTLKTLQTQKAAAEGLAKAVTSKVPEALRSTATTLSAGVADSLQKAITAFEGAASSAPSSSSSGASSGSSSGSSSGASSGSSSGSSAGGVKPATGGSSSAASAPTGYVTKPSTTTSGVKPATYTGAASSNGFGSSVAALAALAAAMAL